MARKIFIMGIDGGTLDIILPLIDQGRLPNLKRLTDGGVWGTLTSTIHPLTPAAWSSFATGKNSGKHGIFDFSSPDRKSYRHRLNSARDRAGESFWMLLSRSGRKVIVVNVPFTYPPEKVNGIMISGFDAPGASRSMTFPPGIYDELSAAFGSYTPDWTFPAGETYNIEKYRKKVASTIQRRTETSLYLLKKYPWDLFLTVFNSIDHIQHIFFGMGAPGRKIIEEGYEQMDDALGAFLEEIEKEATVLVMSDHGAGEIKKFFYLDRWLEQEGYLTFRSSPGLKGIARTLAGSGRRWLKRILPVSARGYLRGRLPGARNFLVSQATGQETDWSRTRAYSAGMYGNIYLNLKGREKSGIVERSERDRLCREIISKLSGLEDPETREKVVEKVYRKEELYNGPFLDEAPDLLVKWKGYAYFTKKGIDRKGSIFGKELKLDSSNYPHTGTHRLEGIFLARGPSLKQGMRLEGVHIMDLAPTILFLSGTPIPEDMDGRVATEIFEESFLSHSRPEYYEHPDDRRGEGSGREPGPSAPEENEELEKRLRSLGYIE